MPEPPVCVSESILLTGSLNSEIHVCSSVAEIGSEEVHEDGDRPTLYHPRGCGAPRPRRVAFREIRELFARPRCKSVFRLHRPDLRTRNVPTPVGCLPHT